MGPTRDVVLRRLDAALADTVVLGVGTNTAFLRRLLAHPDVRAGRLDTGLVERALDALVGGDVSLSALTAFALAGREVLRRRRRPVGPADRLAPGARGATALGPRLPRAAHDVDARRRHARLAGAEHHVTSAPTQDGLLVTVDGVTAHALVARTGGTTGVHVEG